MVSIEKIFTKYLKASADKKKKKKRNLMATIHHIERSHNKLILL